jgi:hypothetical protein
MVVVFIVVLLVILGYFLTPVVAKLIASLPGLFNRGWLAAGRLPFPGSDREQQQSSWRWHSPAVGPGPPTPGSRPR